MTDDFSGDVEQPKQSKYNAAISQLYRLDLLWQDTHRHARLGKLKEWNWDLDRVWAELAADSAPDAEEKFEEFFKQISENVRDKNWEALYHILMKKEIFLRKMQNKQGKGSAYEESVEDYMDG